MFEHPKWAAVGLRCRGSQSSIFINRNIDPKHIILVIFTVSMIEIRCGVVVVVVVGNEGYNAVNAKPTNRRGGYKIGEW